MAKKVSRIWKGVGITAIVALALLALAWGAGILPQSPAASSRSPCCGYVKVNITDFSLNGNSSYCIGIVGISGLELSSYVKGLIRDNRLNSTWNYTEYCVNHGLNASKYLNYTGIDTWSVGGPLGVLNATYWNVSLDGQVYSVPKGAEYLVARVWLCILYANLSLHSLVTVDLVLGLAPSVANFVPIVNNAPHALFANCSQNVEVAIKSATSASTLFDTDWTVSIDISGVPGTYNGTAIFPT